MESNNIELITRMVIQAINQNEKKGDGFMVPIGVSARHIHLTQEHVEALFGPGYQLTKKKELMGGQFASNETVTIVGLKLRAIENVRILGPVRKASQVEVSATDAIKLGMNVPVRESGRCRKCTNRNRRSKRSRLSERGMYRGNAPYTYVSERCTGCRCEGRRYRISKGR